MISAMGRAPHYDIRTIALHWITAALIALNWVLAQVIDLPPTRDGRTIVRSVHITIGVVLILVLAARIWWRAGEGRRLPAADRGALRVFAKATHYTLYLLVAVQLLSGVAFTFARGDSLYTLFRLPKVMPAWIDLDDVAGNIHGLTAKLILIVAAIHTLAALVHHYVWRDTTLRRMMAG